MPNDALAASTAYVRRMVDVRAWVRGLLKNAVHTGTGSLLSALGTNGVENLSPEVLKPYVQGIGMSFSQAVAVFAVACGFAALRYVNISTAPGDTTPPIP